MPELTQLSIIVVTYDSARHLKRCLESIAEHFGELDYEVCVVDNASTDGSPALAAEVETRVRVVVNERNLGFSSAVNVGLRNTTGRCVMWLNPDTRILGGDVRALLRVFDDEPSVGIIGPRLENADGTIQLSCRSFPSYDTALFNRYSLLTRLFPRNRFSSRYLYSQWDHQNPRDVDWVSGACLLHRRSLIDEIGAPDARFFMYIEDIDFCLRAAKAGWRVRYQPELRVLHHIGGSSRKEPFRLVIELHKSIWLYYTKHFRRNVVKDAVARAVIWGRCAVMIAGALPRLFRSRS